MAELGRITKRWIMQNSRVSGHAILLRSETKEVLNPPWSFARHSVGTMQTTL